MSDYKINITYTRDRCPFDPKKRSRQYCKVCKALGNPCSGLGTEITVSSRKIGEDKVKQILNIIK